MTCSQSENRLSVLRIPQNVKVASNGCGPHHVASRWAAQPGRPTKVHGPWTIERKLGIIRNGPPTSVRHLNQFNAVRIDELK